MIERIVSNMVRGKMRFARVQGREFLVAPLTMIVPGVLSGSFGPLFYPPDELARSADAWDGVPIVVNHPERNGRAVSASEPGVIERQGIGFVKNARYTMKLVADGYFDLARTRRIDRSILKSLLRGDPIELSTGLLTENEPYNGIYNGKTFSHIARNYEPDHLAVLPGRVGACSLQDGCGVLVNDGVSPELERAVAELKSQGKSKEQTVKVLEKKYPFIRSVIDRLWKVISSTAIGAAKGAAVGAVFGGGAGYLAGAGAGFVNGLFNESLDDDPPLVIPGLYERPQPLTRNYTVVGNMDGGDPLVLPPTISELLANERRDVGCRCGNPRRCTCHDFSDDDDQDMLITPH